MVTNAEPLITVIIPTFRRPELLRRAILSVLHQTFLSLQVCVYDDASNDDTQHVVTQLAETDSRIKYHRHKHNIGTAANFNYGLQLVNTPFFSFLSDDDLLLPHFLEAAMQSLSSSPDVMFYAGVTIQVEDNKIIGISKNGGRFGYLPAPDGLLDIADHQLMWNSIVFRSEVVDRIGLLDAGVGGPADVDFLFRIAAHYPIIISTEPGAIYVLHSRNLYARSSDYGLYVSGFKRVINKVMSDESVSLRARIEAKHSLNAWLSSLLIALAERASSQGEYDNVYVLAELLACFHNEKAKALLLVGRSRLKETSEPAFLLVSWIARWLRLMFPPHLINELKLRHVQRKYRRYLRYLDS